MEMTPLLYFFFFFFFFLTPEVEAMMTSPGEPLNVLPAQQDTSKTSDIGTDSLHTQFFGTAVHRYSSCMVHGYGFFILFF